MQVNNDSILDLIHLLDDKFKLLALEAEFNLLIV
jgi:hypothetical protein